MEKKEQVKSSMKRVPADMDGHAIAADKTLSSTARARKMFQWLIAPMSVEKFYTDYYEKKPLLLKREQRLYFNGWFSKDEMDRIMRQNELIFGVDIDLTKFENGVRQNLNPARTANAETVWGHFDAGCSVRILRPHRYSDTLWALLSALEEEWGRMAGFRTSAFLTPGGGSRALAPHFDDIEAFAMQLEGKKRWRLYQSVNDNDALPRVPSRNFREDELPPMLMDVVLEPGDLLYFPRGCIHQAMSQPDIGAHSLHITVSCGRKDLWADFMETLIPQVSLLYTSVCGIFAGPCIRCTLYPLHTSPTRHYIHTLHTSLYPYVAHVRHPTLYPHSSCRRCRRW
jgi:lysine-specific demethylase/histidyl-hydroxylase NO66